MVSVRESLVAVYHKDRPPVVVLVFAGGAVSLSVTGEKAAMRGGMWRGLTHPNLNISSVGGAMKSAPVVCTSHSSPQFS